MSGPPPAKHWAKASFDELFTNVTSSSKKLPLGMYSETGRFPVIDQGELEVGGYTDDETLVHQGPLPAVIFGDHTRAVKFSGSPFVQGADGVKVLAPAPAVFARYAFWALKAAEIPSKGYARHYSLLRRLSFPLPPVLEQKAIVEAIEDYLSRLEDAVATLERVQRNLKRYRASVLKAAVEGRLVRTEAELAKAEKRDYEPASVLLKRILVERRRRWEEAELAKMKASGKTPKDEKWKAKYEEPAEPDTTDLPELPEGWCWATVEQLVWQVKDGPHFSPEYCDEGIPFITGGHVRPDGVDFDSAKRISPQLHEELSRRIKPEVGDILYTKGGTTGIARVNTYDRPFSVWVHVAVLKLVGIVDPFYLQHALNSPWCYRLARKYTHGVGNQDLGLTRMINITVPLAPLAEQARVISEVDRQMSVISELEPQVRKNVLVAKKLRQSILKWAFEGKLVDQDPNEESASVLLERIRAEREAAAPAQKQVAAHRARRASRKP